MMPPSSGVGFQRFDGCQPAFFDDQSQAIAIKADLDLAAVPRSNRILPVAFQAQA